MKPEIKQRIEQIKGGQVPGGYKKTKEGIIPTEWEYCTISDCLEKVDAPVRVEADKVYTQIGIRSHGKGLFYKEPVTGKELGNKSVFWIEPNCFVLNIVFAWEQAFGKTTNSEVGMIASHRFPMYRPINNLADLDYLVCYFLTKRGTDILDAASPGGAGRNRTLGQDRFIKSKIMLPPIHEQQKITEILSAQDKLIALKEKLLEEKKKQKKYLMQQLLTGKKRLPGFSGEWKKQKMSDILRERKEENVDQSLRICSVAVSTGVVDQMEHLGKSMAAADTSNYNVVHYGDVVYTKSPTGSFPFGIVKQSQLDEKVAVSPLYGVYEPKLYELGYLLNEYFMYSNNTNGYLLPIVNKGAKNTINISNQTFIKPSMFLPVDDKEIVALARIFKVANTEIDILSKELEQEKQKKKALMQLLLTGIVRVD